MDNEDVKYQYFINTEKFFSMVSSSKKENNKEREITTGYETNEDGKLDPTSKIVREITSNGDTFIDNLKYDFLKTMIMVVIEGFDGDNGDITNNPGALMCLNTLIKDNVVVRQEIKEKEE